MGPWPIFFQQASRPLPGQARPTARYGLPQFSFYTIRPFQIGLPLSSTLHVCKPKPQGSTTAWSLTSLPFPTACPGLWHKSPLSKDQLACWFQSARPPPRYCESRPVLAPPKHVPPIYSTVTVIQSLYPQLLPNFLPLCRPTVLNGHAALFPRSWSHVRLPDRLAPAHQRPLLAHLHQQL